MTVTKEMLKKILDETEKKEIQVEDFNTNRKTTKILRIEKRRTRKRTHFPESAVKS